MFVQINDKANSSSLFSDSQWDNILASTVMFFPIFFSLGCYISFCIVLFRFYKKISNAYYEFVVSLTFSNVPMLLMFAFYATPSTIIQDDLGGSTLNYVTGAFSNLFWYSSLPTYQCIAVNRFISIKYPSKVAKVYTKKNTLCMIAVCWIYGLIYFAISLHPCCYFMYFPEVYSFGYHIKRRGAYIVSFVDVANSTITTVICISFNTFTFLHVRKNNKKVQGSVHANSYSERIKNEKKLFFLFFVVSIYLLIHDAIFVTVPLITISKWGGLLTCITYIIHLSLDGVINLCFNSIIRSGLKTLIKETRKW